MAIDCRASFGLASDGYYPNIRAVADPGFPQMEGEGHQLLSLGHKPNIWQDFCQELHEIERNCTERWCVSLAHPPSGSANAQETPLPPPPPSPRSLRFHETVMKTCRWIYLIQT